MRMETEPIIINVLNIKPRSIKNNTTSVHISNLPVTSTHSLIDMDNIVTSSVMVELNSPIPGSQWPDYINPETLVSELLGRLTHESFKINIVWPMRPTNRRIKFNHNL